MKQSKSLNQRWTLEQLESERKGGIAYKSVKSKLEDRIVWEADLGGSRVIDGLGFVGG